MNPRNLYVGEDNPVILLLIDPQVDFHEPSGSLAVPGSLADSERISKMIMENIDNIDEIFVTLDSHHKRHIAHASFWSDKQNDKEGVGTAPDPFTPILSSELSGKDKDGNDVPIKWYPRDCALEKYVVKYASALEKKGRFVLTIWPDHCLIGTAGHSIQDNIQDAITVWCHKHTTKTVKHIFKGMNCLTEMYSAVEAEVPVETDPSTTKNHELLVELRKAKRLIVCGQAKSHCVNYTLADIVKDWKKHQKHRLGDIYLLTDGCSSVYGFAKEGEKFVNEMELAGVKVVRCEEAFKDFDRDAPVGVASVKSSMKLN